MSINMITTSDIITRDLLAMATYIDAVKAIEHFREIRGVALGDHGEKWHRVSGHIKRLEEIERRAINILGLPVNDGEEA